MRLLLYTEQAKQISRFQQDFCRSFSSLASITTDAVLPRPSAVAEWLLRNTLRQSDLFKNSSSL
jgi:hypothetical protein